MFHPSTERLIDYWRSKAVNAAMPARAAVNPADFLDLLPQVFILGRDGKGRYPVRLAGGFVADLDGLGRRFGGGRRAPYNPFH